MQLIANKTGKLLRSQSVHLEQQAALMLTPLQTQVRAYQFDYFQSLFVHVLLWQSLQNAVRSWSMSLHSVRIIHHFHSEPDMTCAECTWSFFCTPMHLLPALNTRMHSRHDKPCSPCCSFGLLRQGPAVAAALKCMQSCSKLHMG